MPLLCITKTAELSYNYNRQKGSPFPTVLTTDNFTRARVWLRDPSSTHKSKRKQGIAVNGITRPRRLGGSRTTRLQKWTTHPHEKTSLKTLQITELCFRFVQGSGIGKKIG